VTASICREAPGESAGEIHESTGLRLIHLGEVDDHRYAIAEGLGDSLGVLVPAWVDGEGSRLHQSGKHSSGMRRSGMTGAGRRWAAGMM
jgi:hypothetical protein